MWGPFSLQPNWIKSVLCSENRDLKIESNHFNGNWRNCKSRWTVTAFRMQWSLFFIHGGLCETLWVINVFIATPMDSLSISGPLNVPKWHKRVSEPERIPEESRSSFKRLKTWNSFSDNKKKASGYRFITGPRIFKNISRIPTRLRIWDNPDSSSC